MKSNEQSWQNLIAFIGFSNLKVFFRNFFELIIYLFIYREKRSKNYTLSVLHENVLCQDEKESISLQQNYGRNCAFILIYFKIIYIIKTILELNIPVSVFFLYVQSILRIYKSYLRLSRHKYFKSSMNVFVLGSFSHRLINCSAGLFLPNCNPFCLHSGLFVLFSGFEVANQRKEENESLILLWFCNLVKQSR